MFKITNEWLDQHRTKKGGWTKKQAEVLGFSWPLVKKWKRQAIGHSIPVKTRVNFESAANITCKTNLASRKKNDFTIESCIEYLCSNHASITCEQTTEINKLVNRLWDFKVLKKE